MGAVSPGKKYNWCPGCSRRTIYGYCGRPDCDSRRMAAQMQIDKLVQGQLFKGGS